MHRANLATHVYPNCVFPAAVSLPVVLPARPPSYFRTCRPPYLSTCGPACLSVPEVSSPLSGEDDRTRTSFPETRHLPIQLQQCTFQLHADASPRIETTFVNDAHFTLQLFTLLFLTSLRVQTSPSSSCSHSS
eukprot:5377722-Pleurochrysis_carterae.AAC.1